MLLVIVMSLNRYCTQLCFKREIAKFKFNRNVLLQNLNVFFPPLPDKLFFPRYIEVKNRRKKNYFVYLVLEKGLKCGRGETTATTKLL